MNEWTGCVCVDLDFTGINERGRDLVLIWSIIIIEENDTN